MEKNKAWTNSVLNSISRLPNDKSPDKSPNNEANNCATIRLRINTSNTLLYVFSPQPMAHAVRKLCVHCVWLGPLHNISKTRSRMSLFRKFFFCLHFVLFWDQPTVSFPFSAMKKFEEKSCWWVIKMLKYLRACMWCCRLNSGTTSREYYANFIAFFSPKLAE